MLTKLWNNVYAFWALLALPAVYLLVERVVLHGKVAFVPLSGEIAGWLLIATLMVTPLMLLLGPLPWLKERRRHLGVASCLYAGLHLLLWAINANLHDLLRSVLRPEILVGWIAMAILLALALTSTDNMVRKMGTRWKQLQRWVYAGAVLTFLHWILTADSKMSVLVYSGPLIVLSGWRLLRRQMRSNSV